MQGRPKLVVGLGNPSDEYAATRHNVGFRIAERFVETTGLPNFHGRRGTLESRGSLEGGEVVVLKPLSYMNRSGAPVARRLQELDLTPADLLVCYDELALPLGRLRLRAGGSSAGHNGLESVIEALGTDQFPRLRFGIRPEHPVSDQVRFVLSRFRKAELESVEETLDRAAEAVASFCLEGITRTMNRFNVATSSHEA